MATYFLKEIACCVLLAAALVLLVGAGVLVWKAAGSLVGGIRYARGRLTQGRLSEAFLLGRRHVILALPSVWRSARAAVEPELTSKIA